MTARWVEPSQRKEPLSPYGREGEVKTLDLLEHALLPTNLPAVDPVVQEKLQASASQDLLELLEHLERRGRELAEGARIALAKRADQEAKAMAEILELQKKRVSRDGREGRDPQMELDFGDHSQEELRQLESNKRHWEKRLAAIDRELTTEPRAHPVGVRGEGPADRAGRADLHLAGHGIAGRTMANDSELRTHQEWLGYLQPVGLVVSPPALAAAQAFPNKNIIPDHNRFLECVEEVPIPGHDDPAPAVTDLPRFCTRRPGLAGPRPRRVAGGRPAARRARSRAAGIQRDAPADLSPSARRPPGPDGERPWMMLIQRVPIGSDLDDVSEADDHRWQASPQARFERLLARDAGPHRPARRTGRSCGSSTPRGARRRGTSPSPCRAMTEVAGRPIFAALHMLLSRGAALRAAGQAAAARHPVREPQVPEPRLDQARRAGARGALRAGPRLPGGRRPAEGRAAPGGARGGPEPRLRGPAHRADAARVRPLRRGPRPPLERRGLPEVLRGRRASSSGSARTPGGTPTRWTAATARGPSC